MTTMLLAVIQGLFLAAVIGGIEAFDRCPCNSTLTTCIPCNQVCNEEPIFCPLACSDEWSHCQCKPGYLLYKEGSRRCVLEKDCPPPKPPQCKNNDVYSTCGGCDRTCTRRDIVCTLQCRTGCFCAKGDVRDASGKCIPESKCPNNEKYKA